MPEPCPHFSLRTNLPGGFVKSTEVRVWPSLCFPFCLSCPKTGPGYPQTPPPQKKKSINTHL